MALQGEENECRALVQNKGGVGTYVSHLIWTTLLQSLVVMQERRPSVVRSAPNSEKLELQNFMQKFLFKKS